MPSFSLQAMPGTDAVGADWGSVLCRNIKLTLSQWSTQMSLAIFKTGHAGGKQPCKRQGWPSHYCFPTRNPLISFHHLKIKLQPDSFQVNLSLNAQQPSSSPRIYLPWGPSTVLNVLLFLFHNLLSLFLYFCLSLSHTVWDLAWLIPTSYIILKVIFLGKLLLTS